MPEGVLNILKPPGMTSHDVVDGVRAIVGMRRVGHTGTLDPAAAGVLVLMLGRTTRLSEFLTAHRKTYRAEITLGVATDTLDGEGRVLARESARTVDAEQVAEVLGGLTGTLEIAPPMHSAVRHRGERLYEIARAGASVEVEARSITVERFDLLDFAAGDVARALAEVECSSGTYVRSLAAMAGERLGCGAYLSFLVRTRVGSQDVADSLTGAELAQAVRERRLDDVLIRPEDALALPRIVAEGERARERCCGVRVPARQELTDGGMVVVMTPDGRMLGVAEVQREDGRTFIQPRRVMLSEDHLQAP